MVELYKRGICRHNCIGRHLRYLCGKTNLGTHHENAEKNIGESDQQICRGANTREREYYEKAEKNKNGGICVVTISNG